MRILFSRGSGTARSAAAVAGNGFQCARKARDGVVVIMGATGTGKSKLSIDIASEFRGEVVNADKIQVYRGLDITTNKMPLEERRGVPHHLLGELDPLAGELTPAGFRSLATAAVAKIASRGRVPVVAGGSNSYIHAMMVDRYDQRENPFVRTAAARHWLRYRSCLLWVDVEAAVLAEHLDRRVDEMVAMGMVEELGRYFASEGLSAEERHPGLGKAIGVPEFKEYFRRGTVAAYEEAVATIKENTRRLAVQQVRKIVRLGELGWPIKRLDATPVVEARFAGAGREVEAAAWERGVLGPSLREVERILQEDAGRQRLLPHF